MIILLAVIFLFIIILGMVKDWDDEGISAVFFVITVIIAAIIGGCVINGRTIQSKIEMYQEENVKIETSIDTLVKQYMSYESNTFGQLKGESSITLVSLYPELKADKLVDQQLVIYIENNTKIKGLKEKLINVSNYRWWLYFGK